MILIRNVVTHPHQLQWWQWGQILGVMLPILLLSTGMQHLLLWALALHFFVDFTAQTDETSAGKKQKDTRVVLYHAFISGGYAGFILAGLPGLFISAVTHYLIDTTNKFGRGGLTGAFLDQTAHIATLLVIFWLW